MLNSGYPKSGHQFRIGDRVRVRGYGIATINAFVRDGQYAGRIKVIYDDGTYYHVRSADLSIAPSQMMAQIPPLPPTLTREMLEALGLQEDELRQVVEEHMRAEAELPQMSFAYQTGDRVQVHGYGLATIESLVREGQFAGRVKVRYDDGTHYHVLQEHLSPARPAPAPTPASAGAGRGPREPAVQSPVSREMAAAMGIGEEEFRFLVDEHRRAEAEIAAAAAACGRGDGRGASSWMEGGRMSWERARARRG